MEEKNILCLGKKVKTKLTTNEDAGEGSCSSAFHSLSIWWTCSSKTATSVVRLSFLAFWRLVNIPWRSLTRFFAFSFKSRWEVDWHLLFIPFGIDPSLFFHQNYLRSNWRKIKHNEAPTLYIKSVQIAKQNVPRRRKKFIWAFETKTFVMLPLNILPPPLTQFRK